LTGNAALPAQPFDPKAPEMSASVPLLVGNTLNEFINGINKPDAFKLSQDELQTNVRNAYGTGQQGFLRFIERVFRMQITSSYGL
jgi:para-nitrobenzyl esterase